MEKTNRDEGIKYFEGALKRTVDLEESLSKDYSRARRDTKRGVIGALSSLIAGAVAFTIYSPPTNPSEDLVRYETVKSITRCVDKVRTSPPFSVDDTGAEVLYDNSKLKESLEQATELESERGSCLEDLSANLKKEQGELEKIHEIRDYAGDTKKRLIFGLFSIAGLIASAGYSMYKFGLARVCKKCLETAQERREEIRQDLERLKGR